MGKKVELKEGEVFYPKPDNFSARHPFRRIIGIVGDRVFFSAGGDRNYCCKKTSFLAWRGPKAN